MSQAPDDRVVALAPAKINLYLHVLGRRSDGYHLLDSLVIFAYVGERIEASSSDRLQLTVDGPFAADVSGGGDNLVLRAANALAQAAGRPAQAAIRLEKHLPVASGVGGGSADAAATLRALARLWRVDAADDELDRLALSLGADVPMCLHGRPAFVGGIGERVEPAPAMPPCGLLLVNPRIALPTPQVFARRSGPFSAPGRFDGPLTDAAALAGVLADRSNDLTAAAVALVPEIAGVLDALAVTPRVLLARMSGSGATCFGIYAGAAAAASAARDLRSRHPEWWIAAASIAGDGVTD